MLARARADFLMLSTHSTLTFSLSTCVFLYDRDRATVLCPRHPAILHRWCSGCRVYRRAQAGSEGRGHCRCPVRGGACSAVCSAVCSFAVSTQQQQESRTRRDRQLDTEERDSAQKGLVFQWFRLHWNCCTTAVRMRACLRRKRETWRHIVACGGVRCGVVWC